MTEKLSRLLSGKECMIGGHRGLSASCPENTLPAVQAAIDLGVDLIEIDMYLSKDGVPVLAHDEQLERCSNGHGLVSDYTIKELKQLDFGAYKGEVFRGTKTPTLEEFFALMLNYPDVLIDVDVKPFSRGLESGRRAVQTAKQMGILERCIFNSIDCDIVHELYGLVGRRIVGAPEFYPYIKNFREGPHGTFEELWGICVPLDMLTPEVAQRYHHLGITVVTTPADTPRQVEHALACDARLLLSNDPKAAISAVKSMQEEGM